VVIDNTAQFSVPGIATLRLALAALYQPAACCVVMRLGFGGTLGNVLGVCAANLPGSDCFAGCRLSLASATSISFDTRSASA
jgi:hypothetical protein